MITKIEVKVYQKYDGIYDDMDHNGSKQEKEMFKTDDWLTIDSMFQDLELIKKGLCSADFKEKVQVTLAEKFDSEAQNLLKKGIEQLS
jgi:hypothetical protein